MTTPTDGYSQDGQDLGVQQDQSGQGQGYDYSQAGVSNAYGNQGQQGNSGAQGYEDDYSGDSGAQGDSGAGANSGGDPMEQLINMMMGALMSSIEMQAMGVPPHVADRLAWWQAAYGDRMNAGIDVADAQRAQDQYESQYGNVDDYQIDGQDGQDIGDQNGQDDAVLAQDPATQQGQAADGDDNQVTGATQMTPEQIALMLSQRGRV